MAVNPEDAEMQTDVLRVEHGDGEREWEEAKASLSAEECV